VRTRHDHSGQRVYRPADDHGANADADRATCGGGQVSGVGFVSEIFQITGPIQRVAALLAGHGFMVAVPEIYHEMEPAGTVLAYDQAGADRGTRTRLANRSLLTMLMRARRLSFCRDT